jgi:hypothetical protein
MLIERTPGVVIDDVVRLVPRSHGAAPLTVAFTNFPAVLVRAGQWGVGAYPRCGCDACDEDPAWVIEELRRDVDALTAGRVVEKWDGTRLTTTTAYADGGSSSGWTLIDRDRDLYGEPREYAWLPWT